MGQKVRNRVRVQPGVDVRVRGRIQTDQALKQTAAIVAAEESGDEEIPPVEDSPEPPEVEAWGDSDVAVNGVDAASPFDFEWASRLPLIRQLPRRARPPVRFYIDERLEVHKIGVGEDDITNLQHLIAAAVAKHIEDQHVRLEQPGDWCHIPAITDDEGLIELVAPGDSRETLRHRLEHMGSDLKAFAIALPSGDVVTPQALINLARDERRSTRAKDKTDLGLPGTRATRAAALRLSSQRPGEIAGEPWSERDWSRFEDTQRKKKSGGRVKKPFEGA